MTPPVLRDSPSAIRTMRNGHRMFAPGDWVKMAAAFCLGPALIGGVVTLVFSGLADFDGAGWSNWVPQTGARLLYARLLTAVLAPIALAAFAILLAKGLAGWTVTGAMATAPALAMALSGPESAAFFIVAAWLHAGALWWAAWVLEPDALTRVAP